MGGRLLEYKRPSPEALVKGQRPRERGLGMRIGAKIYNQKTFYLLGERASVPE